MQGCHSLALKWNTQLRRVWCYTSTAKFVILVMGEYLETWYILGLIIASKVPVQNTQMNTKRGSCVVFWGWLLVELTHIHSDLFVWGSVLWINSNPGMEKHYILYKVQDEFLHPFPNFNGASIWEWINNFIPAVESHTMLPQVLAPAIYMRQFCLFPCHLFHIVLYFAGYSTAHRLVSDEDTYVIKNLSPGLKTEICMMAEGRTGLSKPTKRWVTLEQGMGIENSQSFLSKCWL